MKDSVIYTHDKAMLIVEMFERILMDYNIRVPSPEDDDRDEDDYGLYGSTYSYLLDLVEDILIEILKSKYEKVLTGVFSGTV